MRSRFDPVPRAGPGKSGGRLPPRIGPSLETQNRRLQERARAIQERSKSAKIRRTDVGFGEDVFIGSGRINQYIDETREGSVGTLVEEFLAYNGFPNPDEVVDRKRKTTMYWEDFDTKVEISVEPIGPKQIYRLRAKVGEEEYTTKVKYDDWMIFSSGEKTIERKDKDDFWFVVPKYPA